MLYTIHIQWKIVCEASPDFMQIQQRPTLYSEYLLSKLIFKTIFKQMSNTPTVYLSVISYTILIHV